MPHTEPDCIFCAHCASAPTLCRRVHASTHLRLPLHQHPHPPPALCPPHFVQGEAPAVKPAEATAGAATAEGQLKVEIARRRAAEREVAGLRVRAPGGFESCGGAAAARASCSPAQVGQAPLVVQSPLPAPATTRCRPYLCAAGPAGGGDGAARGLGGSRIRGARLAGGAAGGEAGR